MYSIDDMKALVLSQPDPTPGDPKGFRDAVIRVAGDSRWGLHRNPGRTAGEESADVIGVRGPWFDPVANTWRTWRIYDILQASDGPNPQKMWSDALQQRDGSTFVQVIQTPDPARAAFVQLPRLSLDGARFMAGDQPFLWVGCTSFDLPMQLAAGDTRWVGFLVDYGFTVARIVVGTLYRLPRTHEDGLVLLGPTLDYLSSRGLYAEVVAICDALDFKLRRDQMLDIVSKVGQHAARTGNAVVEGANEIGHGGQDALLSVPGFLRELVNAVPTSVPFSVGSSHGGVAADRWDQGRYITHHGDRGRTPEVNAEHMGEVQRRLRKSVVDDESLGIAEQSRAGSRTNDPGYAERQARAARAHGLAGATLHLEAGLTANVDRLGPVQREAARRFVAAMKG